ncbi:hypothetical protein R1sor_004158 [Riccia sorocarpa]|uniref:OsmC-like protein n=1 Tax=Riccia sorocarpa TaxID=122646 RepID=A0ABD3H5K7_9MARC
MLRQLFLFGSRISVPSSRVTTTRSTNKSIRCISHIAVSSEDPSGERYKHILQTGVHTFYGDLGSEWGAGGTAPEPKDYAFAALAMCTSMTVRLYAERRNWPLKHVEVTVVEEGGGRGLLPDGLQMILKLDGDLTENQKETLVQISKKCPVKQMFLGKMPNGVHLDCSRTFKPKRYDPCQYFAAQLAPWKRRIKLHDHLGTICWVVDELLPKSADRLVDDSLLIPSNMDYTAVDQAEELSIGGTSVEIELDKMRKPGGEAGSPLQFSIAVSKPKPSAARPPRYPKKKQRSSVDGSRSPNSTTGFDEGKDPKGRLGSGITRLLGNSFGEHNASLLLVKSTLEVINPGLIYGLTMDAEEPTTRNVNKQGRSVHGNTIKEKHIKQHSITKLSLSVAECKVKHYIILMPSGRDGDAYERMLVKDFAEPTLRDLCSGKRESCGYSIEDDVVPTKYITGSLRTSRVEVTSPLKEFVMRKKYFAKVAESTELPATIYPDGRSRDSNLKRKMINDEVGGEVISVTCGGHPGLDGEVGGVWDVDRASLKLQQLQIGERCIT